MYSEDDLLPVSGLQHLLFCERQAALIHVEQLWSDNRLTIEGTHLHKRVDEDAPRREVRGDRVILRGLALRSRRLGLVGRADVVELHRADGTVPDAISVQGLAGKWVPFPVDYKRGRPKANRCDEVQLCAQALCLEEMLGVGLHEGALFYGRQQRRHVVSFGDDLRNDTATAARRFREIVESGVTPRARRAPKCKRCSLLELCMPDATGPGRSALRYLRGALRTASSPAATE